MPPSPSDTSSSRWRWRQPAYWAQQPLHSCQIWVGRSPKPQEVSWLRQCVSLAITRGNAAAVLATACPVRVAQECLPSCVDRSSGPLRENSRQHGHSAGDTVVAVRTGVCPLSLSPPHQSTPPKDRSSSSTLEALPNVKGLINL